MKEELVSRLSPSLLRKVSGKQQSHLESRSHQYSKGQVTLGNARVPFKTCDLIAAGATKGGIGMAVADIPAKMNKKLCTNYLYHPLGQNISGKSRGEEDIEYKIRWVGCFTLLLMFGRVYSYFNAAVDTFGKGLEINKPMDLRLDSEEKGEMF